MKTKIKAKTLLGQLLLMVAIVLFIGIYTTIFGSENSLMGVALVTCFLMMTRISLGIKHMQSAILIVVLFLIAAGASSLSLINPYVGFFINFVSVFFIIAATTQDITHKAHIAFMLCYVFSQGSPVSGDAFILKMISIIILSIVTGIVYYICHRKKDDTDNISIPEIFHYVADDNVRLSFATRMALGLSVAMFIGDLFNLVQPMWISVAVLSLTQPISYKDTRARAAARVWGTFVGSFFFIIIFHFLVPEEYYMYALLILGYIYTFVKEYRHQTIFITMNALAASMIFLNSGESISLRIIFLLLGIAIALVVNVINLEPFYKRIKAWWIRHK